MEIPEQSLFVPSGRWDTVTTPSAISNSSGITMVAEQDITGNPTEPPMPNSSPLDFIHGNRGLSHCNMLLHC